VYDECTACSDAKDGIRYTSGVSKVPHHSKVTPAACACSRFSCANKGVRAGRHAHRWRRVRKHSARRPSILAVPEDGVTSRYFGVWHGIESKYSVRARERGRTAGGELEKRVSREDWAVDGSSSKTKMKMVTRASQAAQKWSGTPRCTPIGDVCSQKILQQDQSESHSTNESRAGQSAKEKKETRCHQRGQPAETFYCIIKDPRA
jgi:hypothetical protein